MFVYFTLLDDKTVNCDNGQAVSVFGDFCQECPLVHLYSSFAVSSNCSYNLNHFCPLYDDASKICIDKVDVSITNYCSYGGQNEYWKCPKANKGLKFDQCYDMYVKKDPFFVSRIE